MTTFSPSDAALEGFQVLRRHWRVVVGWAGFNLLAMIAMVVFTVLVLLVFEIGGGLESRPELAGQVGGVVATVGYLTIEVVIVAGLYRLLLRPDDPGFLHLRLGARELRVLAGILVPGFVVAVLFFVVAIIVGAVLQRSVWGAFALGAAAVLSLAVLWLRFALTPVIGFAEGGLPLLAAWRMSRGQTWRLSGMAVVVFCLLVVIGVAAWLVLVLAGGALTGFGDLGLSGVENLEAHPGRYAFQIVAELVLMPVFLVIAFTPLVAVYRALKTPAEAPA